MSKSFRKITSVALSMATAITLSGSAMVLPASAATVDDLQAQIASLLAQISALQSQLSGAQTTTTASYNFTRDLTLGSKGDDVKALQQFLNAKGYAVASTGAGSAGNETTYYGSLTVKALAKYQAAVGISPAVGYFGPKTRAYVASVAATGGTTTGGGTTTTPVGAALSVAVASDSPAAKTLGSGTAFNAGLKVVFTAGSTDVSITSITFQKSGFVANTNLNGVDVIDSAGVRHGQVSTSVNADNTITIFMTQDPIVVKAGKSETATVRFNLLAGAYSGTLNFSIASASAIAANATFSGSFPLTGATMNIVDGSSSLGTVTLSILTSTGSSTLNVDPASLQEITKYRIAETSSKEGVYLYGWTLYNYGNAAAADYKDVTLEDNTGTVVATAQPSGQYVTFKPTTPYFIDKGLTKDFTIKAKIAGGTTKTIKLVTYNDYDLDVRGATTGVSIIPTGTGNDTSFPIGNAWNMTTIGSGGITLQRATDSPSSAVVPGANNIVLAKFTVKPTGEDYELRQVKFYVATSSTYATSAHVLSGTVYVKVNNSIVYSVAASSIGVGAQTTVNLSSYPILTAGQDSTISIEGSISSSATASDTYKVTSFDLTSAKRLTSNDLLSDGDTGLNVAAVDGLTIPVQAAKLVVTTLSTPVANSVVVGSSDYEFAQIQLNAQSGGEDVKVTSVTVSSTVSASGALADVSNLRMFKDNETTALSTTASTASNAATVTFSFSTPIVVPKATPVTLHLKANVVADTAGDGSGTQRFVVASSSSAVAATGYTTGNSLTHGTDITYAGSGQAMTIVSSGKVIFSLVSGSGASPSSNQIVNVGTSNGVYLAFKLTSQYEAQKITSLKLTSVATALATTTLTNIRLYEGSATTPFASAPQFDNCTGTQCEVTFTASDNLLSAPVPTTGVTIYAKADIAAGGSSILGNDFKFSVASTTHIVSKGAVSAAAGTITGSASSSGVSYITPQNVKIEAISPTTATQVGTSAGQNLAVFKVTNNGTAAISLSTTTMTFTNGGSATTTTSFKIYASAMGGGQSDTSGWNSGSGYLASTTATGAASSISFATSTLTATERKIDGGSWRYLTIRNSAASANNDTYQFSVSALGNILFEADEADLGYDGNGDGDLSDTITDLKVDGIPALSTVTAKT
ncbi:MAG: peptidoglycan-binding domain-containing protein [Candidatus Paceibacterota bacterium]